jgi:Na+/H+ antiporter NhaD/arsenite permease-like protein
MLQRIQTIWLLLAGIAALLTIQFPYYSGINDPAVSYQELSGKSAGIPILLVTITIAVLAFVAIGLFKNRKTQLRLCVVALVGEALLIFLYFKKAQQFTQGTLSLTAILHMLILLFIVLAAKGINSDEKLIKDSDRLR